MRTTKAATRLLSGLLVLSVATPALAGVVTGWQKAGTDPAGYDVGTETLASGTAAYLQGLKPAEGGSGLLLQHFAADDYRGKRMRLTARLRCEDVSTMGAMWMRVDRAGKPLAFDNMMNRAFRGTAEWRECSIVLDVPEEADTILFGMGLSGPGTLWMDDVSFQEVGSDVPVTDLMQRPASAGPQNLDFRE